MTIKKPHRLLTLAALLAALPAAAAPDSIIDLGTLQNNNEGRSSVAAINQNGSIIVGDAFNGTDNQAVVWQGGGFNRWQNKTNLGTLRSDNSGQSKALGISGNGTVIGGQAQNDTDTANDQYHTTPLFGTAVTGRTKHRSVSRSTQNIREFGVSAEMARWPSATQSITAGAGRVPMYGAARITASVPISAA